MKQYTICILLVLATGQQIVGQTISRLLDKVSKTENVEKVKLDRLGMSLVKNLGGMKDVPCMKNIHSMEVLTLDANNRELRQELQDQVNSLEDEGGYATLLRVNDKENGIRIVMKKEGETIKELIFFCMDETNPTILRFKGKIKETELAELVGKYDK